jgi:hypothetical protein
VTINNHRYHKSATTAVWPSGTLIKRESHNNRMSETEIQSKEIEGEGQEATDQAVEEALDFDFTSFEEVKEAFRS